jgi:hypothetical protein
MKLVAVLLCALLMSFMVVSLGFTGDKMGNNTPDYKAVPKAMHEKVFPEGHPAVDQWQNHCYWDEKDQVYFCSDDYWQ